MKLFRYRKPSFLGIPNAKRFFKKAFSWFFSINGLVFTLLIGISISLISNYVQDRIERQRYLELLQLELRSNYNNAVSYIQRVDEKGAILVYVPYQTAVYEAGLQSGYILTIDPQLQAEIYVLYSGYIPSINKLSNHATEITSFYEAAWEKCILESGISKQSCAEETQLRDLANKEYSGILKDHAEAVKKNIQEVSFKFNPTKERLNSSILRLFMGEQRLKVQE